MKALEPGSGGVSFFILVGRHPVVKLEGWAAKMCIISGNTDFGVI